jgi:hypothetical protein
MSFPIPDFIHRQFSPQSEALFFRPVAGKLEPSAQGPMFCQIRFGEERTTPRMNPRLELPTRPDALGALGAQAIGGSPTVSSTP